MVRIRFSVCLVSGYAHVGLFVLFPLHCYIGRALKLHKVVCVRAQKARVAIEHR